MSAAFPSVCPRLPGRPLRPARVCVAQALPGPFENPSLGHQAGLHPGKLQ